MPLRQPILRWEKYWGDLVVTDRSLSTRRWEIAWDDVEAIWIGRLATGQPALTIRPRSRGDIRFHGSWLARLAQAGRHVQLAEILFDRPMDDVLEILSAKSGRSFAASPEAEPLF